MTKWAQQDLTELGFLVGAEVAGFFVGALSQQFESTIIKGDSSHYN